MTSEPQPAALQQKERCVVCGAEIPELGVYCPNCGATKPSMQGKPVPYAPSWMRTGWMQPAQRAPVSARAVFKMLASFAMLTLIAWVLFAFVTLIYGVGIVSPEIQDGTLEAFPLFVAVPYLVTFASLSGTGLLLYYFFLVAAIVASVTWVLISSAKGYLKELSMKAKPRDHSAVFAVCAVFFATLFLNFIIVIVTGAANDNAPGTSQTTGELLLSLANASVWEEIVVRVLLVGIPLVVIDLIRRKMRKDWHAYLLGGRFVIGLPEAVLIIFSASMFGVAHYLGGWGEWKIPAAGIAGLAFGYLFLRYGIAAAITLHFTFDYLGMPAEVFSEDLNLLVGLLAFAWLAVGAAFTVYYIVRIVESLTGRKYWEGRPQPALYAWPYQPWRYQQGSSPAPYGDVYYGPGYSPPSVYQNPSGGYVCPVCGSLEARWKDGRFQCLRCGHLS